MKNLLSHFLGGATKQNIKTSCFDFMLYVAEFFQFSGKNFYIFNFFYLLQISWERPLLFITCTFLLTNNKSPFQVHLLVTLLRFVSTNFSQNYHKSHGLPEEHPTVWTLQKCPPEFKWIKKALRIVTLTRQKN